MTALEESMRLEGVLGEAAGNVQKEMAYFSFVDVIRDLDGHI
jgi:hypothetical protein